MKKKILTIGLISSMILMMISSTMPNVVGGTETEVELNGDPNRVLETELKYKFPTASYFMFKNNFTESALVSLDGMIADNDTATAIDYELQRVSYLSIDNTTTNVTIKKYENVTNEPTIPMDIADWEYDSNETLAVNNTLKSIMSAIPYFPEDVFVSDLMQDDDSFYEVFMSTMGFSLLYVPYVGHILINLTKYADQGNVTLYKNQNSTELDADKFDGSINTSLYFDFLTIDSIGGVPKDLKINVTLDFKVNMSMNCYHVADAMDMFYEMNIIMTNATNTSNHMNIYIGILMHQSLIYSSTIPCMKAGFDWIWYIVIVLAIGLLGVIGLMMTRQNKQCEEVTNMVRKGKDRSLTQTEFDDLPSACKNKKIKPKSK